MHKRSIKGPGFTAGWGQDLQTRDPLGGRGLPAMAAMMHARPVQRAALQVHLDWAQGEVLL